jgi:CDP-6-deoxy-D-xylo-4-hexulose-3-dehydrase
MIRYPLATSSWDDAEIRALQSVIESGNFTMGAKVQEFEKAFSQHVGSKFAVMCSSGSTANLLMTAALFYRKAGALRAGDEVIVPAVSWSTTYYPLHQYGLKLKFVDIDLQTLNYDLQALEAAVSKNTKLIMTVNLLGNANDFARLQAIADSVGAIIIEDNCESLGATYNGQQTGTFGVMGSYSCFFSHHISTMEGGFVVTDDEELYHILLCLRAHGWTRNLPEINHVTGRKSDDPFEESFKFALPGYNVRPLEMSGAVGLEQLKKLNGFVSERRKNAETFLKLFTDHPYLMPQAEIGQSSWFGFSLVIKKESRKPRKELVQRLRENGIECRPIVGGNFAKNSVMKWFNYEIHGSLPNADWIDTNGFFVGNHQYAITEQLELLRKVLSY